jgi:hypothetical protein
VVGVNGNLIAEYISRLRASLRTPADHSKEAPHAG